MRPLQGPHDYRLAQFQWTIIQPLLSPWCHGTSKKNQKKKGGTLNTPSSHPPILNVLNVLNVECPECAECPD